MFTASARAARLLLALLLAVLTPTLAWPCACGCGVFDVQTGGMLPTQPGGLAFLEYDFMNQNQNWGGLSKASSADNSDLQLRTHFVTAGVQYMLDREWGYSLELPVWDRYFKTTDSGGNVVGFTHASVGDVRVRGVYTGFSPDMTSGVTFGAKLPTGDWKYGNFDRDTEIGTGSTDLLLSAYHLGALSADHRWAYFANAQLDEPVLIMAGYRPGAEVDAVAGAYYDDWRVGALKIAPIAQAIGAWRGRDSGPAAHSSDTGYRRLLLAPGVEVGEGRWRADASVGFPVLQYYNGDQLAAAEFFKLAVSWSF